MRRIFRIILPVILISLFCLLPSTSLAQIIKYPMSVTYISSDTSAAVAANKEIYGYTLIATAANGIAGLYNSTLGASSTTTIISELAEATSGNSQTIWFPKPIVSGADGCAVVVDGAAIIIYHQP